MVPGTPGQGHRGQTSELVTSHHPSIELCVCQLRVRQEAEERERDREMVAVLVGRDDALTAHERRLAEEARYDLLSPSPPCQ